MSIKSLYVHTLDDSVFKEVNKSFNQKCCDNNLQINYDPNLTSLYVGYTGIGVNERIQQHKEGYKSSKWMEYASYPPKGLGLVYKASAHHNLLSKLDELELVSGTVRFSTSLASGVVRESAPEGVSVGTWLSRVDQ